MTYWLTSISARAMDAVEAFDRYDSGSRYPHPSHVNPPTGLSEQPLRVDPKYPLPAPQRGSYNPDGSSWAEGDKYSPESSVGRTSSRRRRVSGQGNGAYLASSPRNPQLLVTEGNLQGPSDRHRDANGPNGDGYRNNFSPTNPSSKSFAARARMAPDHPELIPAPYAANGDRAHVRRPRRSSIPQPAPGLSQIPTQATSTPQHADPKSPRMSSNSAAPREHRESSQTHPDPQGNVSGGSSQPPISKTASTRTRPRDSDELRPKWATDRSPLQKLEVKLQDISKEEKRARAQEAEQRLRESTAGQSDRRRSSGAQATTYRTPSTRVSNDVAAREHQTGRASERERNSPRQVSKDIRNGSERRAEPVVREHDVDLGSNQRRRRTSEPTTQPEFVSNQPARAVSIGQDRRGKRLADASSNLTHNATSSPLNTDRTNHTQRNEQVDANETSGINATRTDSRGIQGGQAITTVDDERRRSRTYDLKPSITGDIASGKSKKVPTQQQQLYAHRAEPSNGHRFDHMEHTDDPVPGHKVQSRVHALKHEVPPQTASGIEARQQIGFSTRVDEVSDNLPPHKHHLSRLLHHSHHAEEPAVVHGGPPRHLDEWRKGGVARLTLADIISNAEAVKKNTAWWERDSRASSSRVPDGQQGLYDGGMNESNGKVHFSLLPTIKRSRTAIGGSREDFGVVRARQYIGYEGTLHGRRRNRSWLHRSESLIDFHSALKISPPQSLLRIDSEFAPVDLYHENLRKPYLSKTLTRSMRSIRVRTPIAPTSFSPPLYLKCGPLLRYTGLRRDKVERTGRRAATDERETWRGSIMIVTVDSQSSYEPAPTLRLFYQPMELLPLPPQSLDGQDIDFLDPIGGLPKMTRTGGVVYVKPVEDLDPETDVSRIEGDEGLYEVTRTAIVPTDYGKANELLGRSPPSFARKKRDPKTMGGYEEVRGVRLHAERGVTFWRFNLEIELGDAQARIGYRINKGASTGFWIPARGQTMNIMFHSCNGFSLSVK